MGAESNSGRAGSTLVATPLVERAAGTKKGTGGLVEGQHVRELLYEVYFLFSPYLFIYLHSLSFFSIVLACGRRPPAGPGAPD